MEIGNEWIENRFWRRIDLHTWMFDYEFVLCSWWSQFLKSVLSSHWMMIWKWLHAYAPSSHFSRLTLFLPLLGLQWHTLHLAANARTTLMFVQKKINRQNDLKIRHPRCWAALRLTILIIRFTVFENHLKSPITIHQTFHLIIAFLMQNMLQNETCLRWFSSTVRLRESGLKSFRFEKYSLKFRIVIVRKVAWSHKSLICMGAQRLWPPTEVGTLQGAKNGQLE